MTFIGFAEKVVPKKGEENNPPVWATRILRLKQSNPQRGFQMTIVPVCATDQLKCEVTAQEMKEPTVVFAKRLAINPVQLGNSSGDCVLKIAGKPMITLSPDSPGNYVVILYDDEDGNVKAISFFDPKFVIAG